MDIGRPTRDTPPNDARARRFYSTLLMKMKRIAILTALLLAGCARLHTQRGDFAAFLTDTLEAHGASLPRPIAQADDLPSSWQYKPDEHGVVIFVPLEGFTAIDRSFRAAWGQPKIWCDENLDGSPQGVYGPKQAGCAVQYLECEGQTQIVILKKPERAEQHGGRVSSEGAPSAPPNEPSP